MAQHDFSISNAAGAAFRTDINNALNAIATISSGSVEPAVKFPGMLWLDLSGGGDGLIRRRNQANTGWLTDVAGVDATARAAAAAAQATADSAVQRGGSEAQRTMTAPLVLPLDVPVANQAVSRAQADLLYQVRLLPASGGALLLGTAHGWDAKLSPGIDGSALSMMGGAPVWQQTATAAAPNSIVRTLSDGTIDPTFIPSIASGLRYCGTFKPVVGDEYPKAGDNGHGNSGTPVIGDFWVIDGLTTAGYVYLTGSLAGVVVYNGDSISYDGVKWFRMGSSVSLQGYLKTDGSSAMAGALNMGTNAITEVGAITARAGAQPLVSNFHIDASNLVIAPMRGASGADLANLSLGRIGIDMGRMQIVVGQDAFNASMLPVRYHSTTAAYVADDVVHAVGNLWKAPGAVAAGAFVAAQWQPALFDKPGLTITNPLSLSSDLTLRYTPGTDRWLTWYRTNTNKTAYRIGMDAAGVFAITSHDTAGASLGNALAIEDGTTNLRMTGMLRLDRMNKSAIGLASTGFGPLQFYVAYTATAIDFNLADDAGNFTGQAFRIKRGANGAPVGCSIVTGRMVVNESNLTGTLQLGSNASMFMYGSGTDFQFTHACVAPAFNATCDKRIKSRIKYREPRAFESLRIADFFREDTQSDSAGIIAQDVKPLAPEYVSIVQPHEGKPMLGVNVAGLALEIALWSRDQILKLQGVKPDAAD